MNDFGFDHILRDEGIAYTTGSPLDQVEIARRGISKKSLLKIAEWSSLSIRELSALLPVTLRTIQRYRDDELLDPNVSERALLIVEVLEKGMEVFNSRETLQTWLHTPMPAFDQQTPLSLLDTGFGARMVMDTLGRIEHGVFS
ncbi:MAG: antitoxin Xre/MbcA/ParS toxin-binding domain-containing protein [Balneolaceae bacterium]